MRTKDEARLSGDRDAAIERLLRQMPGDADGPGPCLEPEVLAAWMEGGLSATERAAAQRHAASCDRCQAMIAAMVRAEPPLPRPVRWWSTGAIRWMVPLAAGAVAFALWLAIDPSILRAPTVQAPAETALKSTPPSSAAPAANQPAAQITQPPLAAPPLPAAKDRLEAAARRDEGRVAGKVAPPASAPAAPPPLDKAVGGARAQTDLRNEVKANAAAGAPVAPPAAAPPAARALAAEGAVAVPAFEIASPSSSTRWRIVSPDRVDRSTDAGATWARVDLPAGAQVMAGVSPAAGVCWLVGRNGLVLRTTDGSTWTRIQFPQPLTLVGVRSTGTDAAVVTSDTGVSFATTDGGRTWSGRRPVSA
jgi:hypothetical protein